MKIYKMAKIKTRCTAPLHTANVTDASIHSDVTRGSPASETFRRLKRNHGTKTKHPSAGDFD